MLSLRRLPPEITLFYAACTGIAALGCTTGWHDSVRQSRAERDWYKAQIKADKQREKEAEKLSRQRGVQRKARMRCNCCGHLLAPKTQPTLIPCMWMSSSVPIRLTPCPTKP